MANSNVSAVLVHGAWADGSSWRKIIERLEAQGSSQGPARPGTPTALKALGPGSLARRPVPQTGQRRSRTPPGASRRSIPPISRGAGKQGDGPARRPENNDTGQRSVG